MLPSDYMCPRCQCQACYALHRKGFDWVMSMIGLRPARCLTCGKRFYARYSMANDQPEQSNSSSQDQSGDGHVDKMSTVGRNRPRRIDSHNNANKAA